VAGAGVAGAGVAGAGVDVGETDGLAAASGDELGELEGEEVAIDALGESLGVYDEAHPPMREARTATQT